MPLGERIKELRKEHGWSQAELGQRVGNDSQRISRYETGKLTPSIPALIRLAQTLDVTIDHLLIDGAPRRPLTSPNQHIATQLEQLEPHDHEAITHIINGLITKTRIHNALRDAS